MKSSGSSIIALFVSIGLMLSVAACSPEEPSLKLTEDGLGALGSGTLFTVEAVSEALPGLNVMEENVYSEGEPYPAIFVRDGEILVAQVFPRFEMRSYVGALVIHDPRVSFEDRLSLGMRYGDLSVPPVECVAGLEERSGLALCQDGNVPHVGIIFAGEWAGPDGELPPASVLADFKVKELSWSAGVL